MKYFKLTSESKVNAFGVTLFRIELTVDCECEIPKPMSRSMDDRVYCAECRNAVKQYDR